MIGMQVINYKWKYEAGSRCSDDESQRKFASWRPQFMILDGEDYKFQNLLNENISFRIGEKRCTGHFSGGKHVPCPQHRFVVSGNMCAECSKTDDWFGCVRCSGSCINSKQRNGCSKNQYHIYLASFDSILKIGMSFDRRFHNRLIEQGADFGTKIMSVQDGMIARQIEQKISKFLNLPDRITGDIKQDRIFGNPNKASLKISRAIEMLKKSDISISSRPEIYDFRKHYMLSNIVKKPSKLAIKESAIVDGTIVAAKGNVLVLEKNRRYYSFNAHSLVGRELSSI